MVYNKQTWLDSPSQATPINAFRLNHLETQYDEAVAYVNQTKINAFPIGSDLSSLPDGTIYGLYDPPAPPAGPGNLPQKIGWLGINSGGSTMANSLVFNPASPTEGAAPAIGDWMVACVGANAPGGGEDWDVPPGWQLLRIDFQYIGTMRQRFFVRQRQAGDTTYTFPYTGSPRHLNGLMFWVRNAANFSQWLVGPGKARPDAPAESNTCTAPTITTDKPNMLTVAIMVERSTAVEAGDPSWSTATHWAFTPQVGSSIMTFALGTMERVTAGVVPPVVATYSTVQGTNGFGFQIAIANNG